MNQGPVNGQGQGPMGLNVNLSEIDWMKCEKCDNSTFVEAMKIKKVSKFMTGSERDSIVPYPVIACSSCGHVDSEFEPKV